MISECLFVVELSEHGNSWIKLGQSDKGSFLQKTYNFDRGVDYQFRVKAYCGLNESEYSNILYSGVKPEIPLLVTPADISTENTTQLTLAWNTSAGAESYLLQVSESNTYVDFVVNQDIGSVSSKEVTGLRDSTTYYWRVNATNKYGTSSWSNTRIFKTLRFVCGDQISYVTKTYNTVQIGNQCWLSENLDVGIMIQGMQGSSNDGIIEKYCYNNEPANCESYGGLYLWDEAMDYSTAPDIQGLCPKDWHIPTNSESQILAATENSNSNALKTIGQGGGDGAGTNSSGFSTLLSGYRDKNRYFTNMDNYAYYWSSTEHVLGNAFHWLMYYNNNKIYFRGISKENGFSVRCIRDQ
ncbi:MAG: hypothetical protein KKA84_00050 [Bacteroidetes bacterium]|nr:hypothetical protein [Bacteroidota bacterium]